MDKETKATIKDLYSKFDAVKPGESIFYFGSRLNFACDINDVREVKRLLADPAYDPHSRGANGNNCLHMAAWTGAIGSVKLLLKDGRVDPKTSLSLMGNTALMRAAEAGNEEVVQLLLKHSNVDYMSERGDSALNFAALTGCAPIVDLLAKHADPLLANKNGETPLMFAAMSGDAQCIRILLPISDIQAVDKNGENALMKAAAWGNRKAVMQLMKHIPLDQVNNAGLDAIGVAQKALDDGWSSNGKGIQSVIEFLTAYKHSIEGFQNIAESTNKKVLDGAKRRSLGK